MGHQSIARFRAAAIIAQRAVLGAAADLIAASDRRAGQSAAPLIGELESRRRSLGWSVADVSERCGIDVAALCRWEQGDGVPPLDGVQRWAAALGLCFVLIPAERETRQGLQVDWPGRRVTVDGKPVRLTPMEWKALERLARVPGQVVTHQALFHHLYGEERDYRAQSTAIRVLITKLRRLLPLRIEAQWAKGYVLTGLASSLPDALEQRDGVAAAASSQAAAATVLRECSAAPSVPIAPAVPTAAATAGATFAGISQAKASRVAVPPTQRAACRAEELGVIERFLAERGATRCPDVATIQHSPLPTLVWDKAKRKWVRPAASSREAL